MPLDTQTAWLRRDRKGYYALGSLYLCVINKDAKLSDYSREAGKLNIPMVNMMDKRDVVDYLLGKTDSSKQIDGSLRAQTLIKKSDLRAGKITSLQPQLRKRD